MAVNRRYDVMAIMLLAICVAGYASIRSEFRLRTTMPLEFFDASTVPHRISASEEKIARAYWNCAVTQIQWRYGYAHRLPEEPPDEFAVTREQAGTGADAPAVRARYWRKLREVWGVSTLWHKQYEWNGDTLRTSFQSAGEWLEQHMRRIMG